MANELIQAGPYPVPADSPDGPNQMKAIVDWIAGRSVMRFATVAARDTALPSGTVADGQLCFVAADNAFYVRVAGAWWLLSRETEWSTSNPGLTMGTGWTLTAVHHRRVGPWQYLYMRATASTLHTITAATGVISNPDICTLPAAMQARANMAHGLSGGNSRVASVAVVNNMVSITSVAGTGDVTVGQAVTATGAYLLN